MAHITLTNQLPGIIGLMTQRPDTAKPLNMLAEILLQNNEGLSSAERELIAAHVSRLNTCKFCSNAHLNASLAHLNLSPRFIDVTSADVTDAIEVRPVVRALLNVASKVQQDGKRVTEKDINEAKTLGATDNMIHDTVLIAATFCMYNRYVDGLGTWCPEEAEFYGGVGNALAKEGYLNSIK